MSGLQALIGYEGCCCGGEPPCPSTLCGFVDTANNGSIRTLEMPPLFDAGTSFTLSVGSSATFGCVALTPYSDAPIEYTTCYSDVECCCDTQTFPPPAFCLYGGGCAVSECTTAEYGDYHPHPKLFTQRFTPLAGCGATEQLVTTYQYEIQGSNLAQKNWTGDFTTPGACLGTATVGNGCNGDDFCTTPEWLTNYFPMTCVAILNIDGSVGAPAHTNYALIDAAFRVLNISALNWYANRPTCDCKCPFIELTITVTGVIFYSITDVFNQPPNPVDYSTLLPSMTTLTYRKRLVRSKALNYYTYYDWINDTTEPFHLFMIQSGEDGVHQFCEQNAVNGTQYSCNPSNGDCDTIFCSPTGGSPGSAPTTYIESYGSLCSSASSETSNASGISSASCYNYPDEIQLSIAANYSPTITGISPSTGTTAGGTTVTITGSGMWGCHEVVVGGTLAPSFTVNTSSTTSFSFTTPAHGAGAVQVVCKWSWGTTTTNFTYV